MRLGLGLGLDRMQRVASGPVDKILALNLDMVLGAWNPATFLNASATPASFGETVATTLDQTSNANNGTQPVGSERGIWMDAQTPNGSPSLVLDTTDDGFVTPLNLGANYTICMVVKCTPLIAARCANSMTANRLITPGRADYAVYPGNIAYNDLSAYSGVWGVYALRVSGSAVTFRANGVELPTSQVGDVWGVLSYANEGMFGEPSNSSLYAYLAANRAMSDEDILTMEKSAASLAGITIA